MFLHQSGFFKTWITPDELLTNAKTKDDETRFIMSKLHIYMPEVYRDDERKKEFDFDSVWHKVGGRNTRASIQTC